jgi:hypothetical protein
VGGIIDLADGAGFQADERLARLRRTYRSGRGQPASAASQHIIQPVMRAAHEAFKLFAVDTP